MRRVRTLSLLLVVTVHGGAAIAYEAETHAQLAVKSASREVSSIDRVLKFEGETKCIGLKSVTVNEPFFAGHFPGHPVMPGVLQVEAMAQVASILMLKLTKSGAYLWSCRL